MLDILLATLTLSAIHLNVWLFLHGRQKMQENGAPPDIPPSQMLAQYEELL